MSDTAQDQIDLDTLTDDEVMNLGPDQIQALMDQEDAVEDVQTPTPEAEDEVDPNAEPTGSDDDTPSGDATEEERTEQERLESEATEEAAKTEPDPNAEPAAAEEDDKSSEGKEEDPKPAEDAAKPEDKVADPEDKTKAKKEEDKPKAEEPTAEVKAATEFYAEITKPFKADGKDFQVKTAAEAIRLMQMGANYSRRMQEMKPLKAMDAVLKEHGLDDPAKLGQLIDISKGDPAAIQKLLKEKNIDPLDIDVSKPAEYKGKVYSADEKAIGFKEAIANTLQADGGKELIKDMNSQWDEKSKDALYETPQIFETLLAQKSAVDSENVSDYSKINAEVERQRVLGFLTDVPFLQAYTQVSDAMANIDGLLTSAKKSNPAVPAQAAPIDTGPRKAAAKPKTEQPNPTLSSTPPKAKAPAAAKSETDYSSMSDEDFLKLGAPG